MAIIGKGLGIGASAAEPLLREGKITCRHERGEGAKVGRSRLTFFLHNHRVHIIVGETAHFPQRCGSQAK